MQDSQKKFAGFDTLNVFVQDKQKGFILVTYLDVEGYPGMALAILITFDLEKEKYLLDLEWMSMGLDLYGDTLQEYYSYKFSTLKSLTDYLFGKYGIAVTDIPLKYKFDSNNFPNPIYNGDQKEVFEEAWQRFQEDFRNGIFLDTALELAV